jgi:hypothetical protein
MNGNILQSTDEKERLERRGLLVDDDNAFFDNTSRSNDYTARNREYSHFWMDNRTFCVRTAFNKLGMSK